MSFSIAAGMPWMRDFKAAIAGFQESIEDFPHFKNTRTTLDLWLPGFVIPVQSIRGDSEF
jgi:hypothetical protein